MISQAYPRINSLIVVVCIAYLWNRLFKQLWRLDRPGADIIPYRNPVPNYQWVFLVIVYRLCLGIFPWLLENAQILWISIWATVLAWFALINDVVDRYTDMAWLHPALRAVIQIISISYIVSISWVSQWLAIFDVALPSWLALVVSVGWIFVCMNAINRFDFKGIAWGVSLIGFVTIWLLIGWVVIPLYQPVLSSLIALQSIQTLAFIAWMLSFVFLVVERKPWWLLRDVWSNFYGFLLWFLALAWWAKVWIIWATLLLVACDAVWVVIQRVRMRKNPMKWDYTHLHHRLQTLWRSTWEIRAFVWWWTIIMMILMLLQWSNSMHKLIIACVFWAVFFALHIYLYWIKKLPFEYWKPV